MVQDNNSKLLDILNRFNCLDDIKCTTTYKRLMNPNLIKDYTPSVNKHQRLSGGIMNNNNNNISDSDIFNESDSSNNIPMVLSSDSPIPKLPKPDLSMFEENENNNGPIMNFRGQVYMNLSNHLDTVRSISFYENNEVCYILSSGDDCVVKLWKVENFRRGKDAGTPLLTYRGHEYEVYSCCFVNGIPFSCDIKGLIIRWKLPPSNHILTEEIPTIYHFADKKVVGHDDAIWKIRSGYSNSNLFMTISSDKSVKIWENKENDFELKNIYKFNNIVCAGDFFNDKNASDFIVGDIEGNIYCCNLKSGKINITIKAKDLNDKYKRIYSLINVNEMTIASYEDGAIRFFDWTCGEHIETDQINIGPTTEYVNIYNIHSIIQCDSNTLCVCSHDRTVKTISLENHKIVNTIAVYFIYLLYIMLIESLL